MAAYLHDEYAAIILSSYLKKGIVCQEAKLSAYTQNMIITDYPLKSR